MGQRSKFFAIRVGLYFFKSLPRVFQHLDLLLEEFEVFCLVTLKLKLPLHLLVKGGRRRGAQ